MLFFRLHLLPSLCLQLTLLSLLTPHPILHARAQDMVGVHSAEYATPKGEYINYNLREKTALVLPATYDVRIEDWYVESSNLRTDLVIIVSMPLSLKINIGSANAVNLVEGAVNATLSMLSEDDYMQLIVSGYTNPCFNAQYLVLATAANKANALKFLREQISRNMPMGESTIPASSRLAWKLLSDR